MLWPEKASERASAAIIGTEMQPNYNPVLEYLQPEIVATYNLLIAACFTRNHRA